MPNPYVDGIQNGSTTIDIHDKELRESLGTASTYDVPESGDASDDEVVKGDDTRLGNIKGNNTVLTTDKTPFLIRQTLNPTGFSGYVREKLIGASYAWNNLVDASDVSKLHGEACTISASNNKVTMIPVNPGGICRFGVNGGLSLNGRKFLVMAKVTANVAGFTCLIYNGNGWVNFGSLQANVPTYVIGLYTGTATTYLSDAPFGVSAPSSMPSNPSILWDNLQIVDLTLAFGSTIADYLYGLSNNGGITKLRDMGFPIDKYTAYGNYLVSSKTSGKKIVGKNLFNPDDILVGTYSDGKWVWGGTINKLFNYTFLPNTRYTFSGYETQSGNNKNVRPRIVYTDGTVENIFFITNTTRTAFSKTSAENKTIDYIQAYWGSDSSAKVTIENFQIEIDTSATTYKPYCGYEISLGNDELRGKFDLVNGEIIASGDVKESNGEITRNRKRINLGNYTWTYSNDWTIFYTAVSDAKNSPNICVCAKYTDHGTITAFSQLSDKEVSVSSGLSGNPLIVIKDTAYNDATTFKTAMDGVYLEYELATPTTEQSTPFADPMSMVGATTEEYIDTRDIPCPVGAERQYMGESNDVIPIPSSPMSDGKRVLTSYKSGDKEQLVWEGVGANNGGVSVDISSYTSNNKYICPCDGYVQIYSGAGASGYIRVVICGANDIVVAYLYMNISVAYTSDAIFVKKGMKAYVNGNTVTGSSIDFRPLE